MRRLTTFIAGVMASTMLLAAPIATAQQVQPEMPGPGETDCYELYHTNGRVYGVCYTNNGDGTLTVEVTDTGLRWV